MSDTQNLNSDFAPDFEVTFEEEVPIAYDIESNADDYTEQLNTDTLYTPSFYDSDDETSYLYNENEYKEEEDTYKDTDPYDSKPYKEKRIYVTKKKYKKRYGTKDIYKTAYRVVRIVSTMITAGTFFFLLFGFWRGCAPYGDPLTMIKEQNYTLVAYFAFAFIILFYELMAFFWSLTKVKFRVNGKTYREDHGRGLSSFIFLYVTSYISFLLCSFLPEHLELGRYNFLNGLKGSLDVFGSMHNVLLGLCIAGVASCIARKHMS